MTSAEWWATLDELLGSTTLLFDDWLTVWSSYREGMSPADTVAAILQKPAMGVTDNGNA